MSSTYRTEQFNVRVTKAEQDEIRARAKARGLRSGEYLRRCALGETDEQLLQAYNTQIDTKLAGLQDAIAIARAELSGRKDG